MNDSIAIRELDLKLIVVPEDIKRTIDWKTEKSVVFLDSFQRRQINPINVRQVEIEGKGTRFQLVCGQRRFGAAKKLGHATVIAKIENWTDLEIEYLRMVENVHRTQLTPAREALANQKLLAAFAVMFGKDPGNTRNNATVRGKQERTGGRFGSVVKTDEETTLDEKLPKDPSLLPPLNEIVSFNGGEAKSQSESTDATSDAKPFTELLSNATGKSIRTTQVDKLIAEKLNPEELAILERAGMSRNQLHRIAKIEPPDERSAVMCMIAMGQAFDEAIKTVKEEPELVEVRKEAMTEAKMTDAEWLDHFCGNFRKGLQNPLSFEQDAIIYRKMKSARQVFRKQGADIVLELRVRKFTPLCDQFHKTMHVEHPWGWLYCGECMGKNVDKPECRGCLGCGYKVQYHPPKKVRPGK